MAKLPRLSRHKEDDPFAGERPALFTPRFVLALVLIVGGIGWILYYYYGIRPDAGWPVTKGNPASGPTFFQDLEGKNYIIGFVALFLGLMVSAHPSTPLGRGNGVVRHEEQLHVGKERQETGRARLRKYVVTENETVDVPLEREEVRVERTPLSGTEATAGTIGEEDVDVTLHEERPVVAKETVGVEKVGLEKETVRDTERVDAEVRKEQVEVETDAERGTGLTDRNRGTGLTDDDRRDRI